MKKGFKSLLFILFFTILLTGCSMKSDIGLEITKDKKVISTAIIAYDDEMIDALISMDAEDYESEKEYTDEERWAFIDEQLKEDSEKEDVKYEKYEENGYKGYKVSSEEIDLDKISAASASEKYDIYGEEEVEESILFIKDGNTYKSNMEAKVEEDEDLESLEEYSDQMSSLEMNFTITLPVKPLSNNADSVSSDGKTLTWDLSTFENKTIDFEFELEEEKEETEEESEKSEKNMPLIIGLIVIIVIVLIILASILLKKNKKPSEPLNQ